MNQDEQEFFLCSCGAEGILISRYSEDKEIIVSILEYRSPPYFDWRNRLRYIWNVIRTGYPYSNDVILNQSDALRLGQKLVEWSEI